MLRPAARKRTTGPRARRAGTAHRSAGARTPCGERAAEHRAHGPGPGTNEKRRQGTECDDAVEHAQRLGHPRLRRGTAGSSGRGGARAPPRPRATPTRCARPGPAPARRGERGSPARRQAGLAVPRRAVGPEAPAVVAPDDDPVVAQDGGSRLALPEPGGRALAVARTAPRTRGLAGCGDDAARVQLDGAPRAPAAAGRAARPGGTGAASTGSSARVETRGRGGRSPRPRRAPPRPPCRASLRDRRRRSGTRRGPPRR